MGKLIKEHLPPGASLGEIMFGLIMTLTFTLGAGAFFGGTGGGTRALLIATISCNTAWGLIDAAMLLIGTVFERGRFGRIGNAIASSTSDATALALVASELDQPLAGITTPKRRDELYRDIIEQVRRTERRPTRLTRKDFYSALVVFWLVFFSCLPAALPFLVIDDPWIALRVSNAVLIAILFFVGYRWAGYTNLSPIRTGLALVVLSVTLVVIAILLGG